MTCEMAGRVGRRLPGGRGVSVLMIGPGILLRARNPGV